LEIKATTMDLNLAYTRAIDLMELINMAKAAETQQSISEQEYLDGEKLSDTRHEYVDGYVYAMAGSSRRHAEIALNIATSIKQAAKGTPCKTYVSDIKVHAASHKSYFYPDVVVGCDDNESNDYYLEAPCLIVEVLSESTEKRDRREKLLAYMNIPSVQAYMLVAQDRAEVELYYREESGNWWVQVYEQMDDSFLLPCVNQQVTVADVYDGVSF